MADDLSSDSVAPRGVDLIAGAAGRFTRGGAGATGTPTVSGAITATGAIGGSVDVSGHGTARLDLVVATATGTSPSMTVTVQTSFDNGVTDAWRTVASFPAQTAAGTVRQVFTGLDRWVRANVTAISGTTPSFTASLSGELV